MESPSVSAWRYVFECTMQLLSYLKKDKREVARVGATVDTSRRADVLRAYAAACDGTLATLLGELHLRGSKDGTARVYFEELA